jgi:hypothetical protein
MTRIGCMVNWLCGRNAARNCANGVSNTKLKDRAVLLIVTIAALFVVTQVAFAQTRGGALTIRYTAVSPIIALLAGVLILIRPRLLNYIVAFYLILVGLIGVLGV